MVECSDDIVTLDEHTLSVDFTMQQQFLVIDVIKKTIEKKALFIFHKIRAAQL